MPWPTAQHPEAGPRRLRPRLRLRRRLPAAALLLMLAAGPGLAQGPAPGGDGGGDIVAIVNDQPISRYDLDQRIKLMLLTSGIAYTPQNSNRIQSQVLRALIEEQLKLQEMARFSVQVSSPQLNVALQQIARNNEVSAQEIQQNLAENGIDLLTLSRQLTAQIGWDRLIRGRFESQVAVSEGEVQRKLEQAVSSASRPRYAVAEIFLGFDTLAEERQMAQGARQLVEQIRAGAPFAAVAAQFSQSPTAAAGGSVGWVHEGQFPPEVDERLRLMNPGVVSDPIRTADGYYIIWLRNYDEGAQPDPLRNTFDLVRVIFPLEPGDTQTGGAFDRARRFTAEFTTCGDIAGLVEDIGGGEVAEFNGITGEQIPEDQRAAFQSRFPGDVVPARRTVDGLELFAVCGRTDDHGVQITRQDVENRLYGQEINMLAQRHLRDLKRDAIIETR